MDIDDVVYPLLVASFTDNEPGEILDVVEEFKQSRGLDEHSEFEQEVWQKYLTLKREMAGGSKAEASQPRSGGGEGEAAPISGA
jgi:hypothetical protein